MKLAGAYFNDETYARLGELAAASKIPFVTYCRRVLYQAADTGLIFPSPPPSESTTVNTGAASFQPPQTTANAA